MRNRPDPRLPAVDDLIDDDVIDEPMGTEQDCDSCGRSASWCLAKTYWFADNDLWNEVTGSPNGVMCPPCFTLAAEIKGIAIGWRAGRVGEIENG